MHAHKIHKMPLHSSQQCISILLSNFIVVNALVCIGFALQPENGFNEYIFCASM